ncbi:MAG TPA: proline dehydrogenase family protein [Candidatus Eisenbacteria bacterium]|nr:proline dehydrogenase family protein [Candidatus Eisenbacteria bacterium]
MRQLLLAGSQSPWLREQATHRAFVRRAVSRFMPGETLDDGLRAARELAARGLASTITHLGENIGARAEAEAEVAHYRQALDRIAADALDAEVSVKLTHLGLDLDPALATRLTQCLAERSATLGRRLWIDMEGSPYVEPTLALHARVRAATAGVGVCVQSYLRRTSHDVEALIAQGAAVRLVKGAYAEPAAIAFPDKREVDAQFLALAQRLLSEPARANGVWLAVGTHDRALIAAIERFVSDHDIPRDAFEFAMLYGIQTAEQLRLARAGYKVRVLVSYGDSWFPWYMRRLAERPANLWFVLRNMFAR